MLKNLHDNRATQLVLGLLMGVVFGFLLQKGGATSYDVIIGQLLLTDFTVLKIMLSAVIVGMVGVHALSAAGWARLQPKGGGWGTTLAGGLVFGVGFGLLGYCPGTASAAVGQGSMDALIGGVVGILAGSGLFTLAYPKLGKRLLAAGSFRHLTLPEALGVRNHWVVVVPAVLVLAGVLAALEAAGP